MITEEEKYQRLGLLATKLGVLIPLTWLEVDVTLGGKIISHQKQRGHSWNRNAYNLLFCQLSAKHADNSSFGAGYLSGKNTAGALVTMNTAWWVGSGTSNYFSDAWQTSSDVAGASFIAPTNSIAMGIVAGSGNAAESFEGYALVTPITDGVGAGQLSYTQGELNVAAYDAGTKTFTNIIKRYINNNSGGAVNLNEVALIAKTTQGYFMLSRDLTGLVSIPDTAQLKVTYTISLVYPA